MSKLLNEELITSKIELLREVKQYIEKRGSHFYNLVKYYTEKGVI
jgi:hypothetical protein